MLLNVRLERSDLVFLRVINGILVSASVSWQFSDCFDYDGFVILLTDYVSCTSTVWDFFLL